MDSFFYCHSTNMELKHRSKAFNQWQSQEKRQVLSCLIYSYILISLFNLNYMPLLHTTEMYLQYNSKYIRTGSSCKMLPSETKHLYT